MAGDISFGQWVKRRRSALRLTQDELARRIFCSRPMVRKIEADERHPSKELALLLADQLALSPDLRLPFAQVARGARPVDLLPPPEALSLPGLAPDRWVPADLPVAPTPLLGRAHELAILHDLVLRNDTRLLTLTGPPGIGKTRLSIALAEQLCDQFADGVVFIPLAAIALPDLVLTAIAQALGVGESASRPLLNGLKAFLRGRQVLLVLDNFEQVLGAAPLLAELLGCASRLTLLVTSRVALRLSGEQRYAVPPLALPAHDSLGVANSATALAEYSAVALFVQRSQAVNAAFALTADNAPTVAAICERLDGLPLAIELAAARIMLFTPRELLAHLDQRFELLTGGALDLPLRQQTLHAAIAWSYDLLSAAEQIVMRRLGVFVGGFTLSMALQVCDPEGDLGIRVLDGVAALIDRSLVRQDERAPPAEMGETRYLLFETIREFALLQLEASGESERIRRQHALVCLAIAEASSPHRYGAPQAHWLARLDRDHDNLRAAIRWASAAGEHVITLRLAAALGEFWGQRGYWREGRRWVDEILAQPETKDHPIERLQVLLCAEQLIGRCLNDFPRTHAIFAEIEELVAQVGNPQSQAIVLLERGHFMRLLGRRVEAQRLLEQAVDRFRALGDEWNCANTLRDLGDVFRDLEQYANAQACYEQSMTTHERIGDVVEYFWMYIKLGEIARDQRQYGEARRWLEPAVAHFTEAYRAIDRAWAVTSLAIVELAEDHAERAAELFARGLKEFHQVGQLVGVAYALKGLGDVLIHQQQNARRAVHLFGAAEGLLDEIGAGITPRDQIAADHYYDRARAALDPASFDAAWAFGHALPLERAIALALDDDELP